MSTPDKDPVPQDEFERLEELQRQSKAIQEAWRNLLQSLREMDLDRPTDNEPENPKK